MLDQSYRQVAVKTALQEDLFVFSSMRMTEGVSTPFEMDVELLSDSDDIDFSDLLGHNLTVRMERADSTRYFSGHVSRFGFTGSQGRRLVYRAIVSPWLWFLTQTENCRIFHERTALDIVCAIFDEHGFSDYDDRTSDTPPTYEYCVQYRESDFAFVSRLLEREGIFYFFEHENGRCRLVLADTVASMDPEPGYDSIKLFANDQAARRGREGIFSWRPLQSVRSTRFATTDYNFKTPREDLSATGDHTREHALAGLEVYRYPGVYDARGDGDRYARHGAERQQTDFEVVTGEGNTRGLRSGCVFDFEDHPVARFNRKHFVTSVTHEILSDAYESVAGSGGDETYACAFAAIGAHQPFRPPLDTPKPVINGPQTAVVVNDTAGEEIEPDAHGRVKVAFHWERAGESSCWVRVSQGWAGTGWGAMSIPRAGQEVIVEFIDGDPDRPIITGRVYNARTTPPYDPKAHRTVTTFKTNSSKGGGGFNELRFDDKKGSENVFVHAQKDLDLRTTNLRREAVGVAVHTEIGEKEFREIGEEQHESVGHHSFLDVGQDIHRKAGMNVLEQAGMDYVLNAGMNAHVKAGLTTVIEAGTGLTIKVGGSFITLNAGGVFISGPMVMINSGGAALSGPGTKPEAPEPPDKAKTAEPGAVARPGTRSHQPTPQELDSHPVSAALLAAAATGAPFCAMCDRRAREAGAEEEAFGESDTKKEHDFGSVEFEKGPGATDADVELAKQNWEDALTRRMAGGKKPYTVGAMERLQNSDKKTKVVVCKGEKNSARPKSLLHSSDPKKGSSGTIYFNPRKKQKLSDGTMSDPESALAHEAVHVDDFQRGKIRLLRNKETGKYKPDKKLAEQRAGSAENQHRFAKNLPQRKTYGQKQKWKLKQYK